MAREEAKEEEEEEAAKGAHLHGDALEKILSHASTVDLVPASYVSTTWQRAVHRSLRLSPRLQPWLLLHTQSRRNPLRATTHAYDPHSHLWVQIPNTSPAAASSPALLRSSHPGLLYTLTPSKLAFSTDPLNAKWNDVDAPRVWRRDPVVVAVGSHIVVAGGACEFEDDPCAVEVYTNSDSCRPEPSEPLPDAFRSSASSTWLSVAVTGRKMHVIEKNTGLFCSFDVETKTWGSVAELRPDPLLFLLAIGFSGDHLVLVGLGGEETNVTFLRLWEVNCNTLESKEIGDMPPEILKRLACQDSTLSSINVFMGSSFAYIYNPSNPKEVFFCDMAAGTCKWGSIQVPVAVDRILVDRLVFTCSTVGLDDLRKVFRPMARN